MAPLPLSREDEQLIHDVCNVTEIQQLEHTVKAAVKGGVIVGVATTACALLMGPIGFVIGAVAGGGFLATQGTFKSAPEIIMNLNDEEKRYLVDKIRNLLTIENAASVATLTTSASGVTALIDVVTICLRNVRDVDLKLAV